MSFQGYFFYDLTRFSLKIAGRSNARLPQERRGSKKQRDWRGSYGAAETRFSLKIAGRSNARLPQERRGSKIFPEERSGKKYVQKTVR